MGEAGPVIAKKVYERLGEREHMSYTVFHERLRKLEFLRLLDLTVRQEKGRTRVIEGGGGARPGSGRFIGGAGELSCRSVRR